MVDIRTDGYCVTDLPDTKREVLIMETTINGRKKNKLIVLRCLIRDLKTKEGSMGLSTAANSQKTATFDFLRGCLCTFLPWSSAFVPLSMCFEQKSKKMPSTVLL
jgi:hypothetical protein